MTALLDPPTETAAMPISPVFTFDLRQSEQYADMCWFENVLSPDEVERVVGYVKEVKPETATVGLTRDTDRGIRESVVRWVNPQPENLWLFNRLTDLVSTVNNARYNFELWGFKEGMQVAEYGPSSFFSWHKDHGNGTHSVRKLSITIQLSQPDAYEGGDMEFLYSPEITVAPKGLGTAIVFPSYVMHRVTPVRSGLRRSIVSWISGPPYR